MTNSYNIAGQIDNADDFDFDAHGLVNTRTPGEELGEVNVRKVALFLDVNEYGMVCFVGTVEGNTSNEAEETLKSALKCDVTIMCVDEDDKFDW